MLEIPAGALRVGSRPGTAGRRPEVEADLVTVQVPAFRIDALPFPNRPGEAPRTGVTRDEAASLCAAEGKRLCDELEWERACQGDAERLFPTGASLDLAACRAHPESCDSPLGVHALGTAVAEWTSSTAGPRFGDRAGQTITRGSASTDPASHRCASRVAAPPSQSTPELGFRCCEGAAPSLAYPTEPTRPTFADEALDDAALSAALRSVPELARYAEGFHRFDAAETALVFVRGGVEPTALAGQTAVRGVLRWSPVPGEEALVVSGRSGTTSILAVLHPLPGGGYAHGGSMILANDPSSILVTYRVGTPTPLAWTTCFGCAGEGGEIQYRSSDGRIVVVQQ